MSLSPDQLRQILSDADHPLGIKELLRLAGLHPGQQTELKRALRELVRHGHIQKEGKRFLPVEAPASTRREDGSGESRSAGAWLQGPGPARQGGEAPGARAPGASPWAPRVPEGFRGRARVQERHGGRDFGRDAGRHGRGREQRRGFGGKEAPTWRQNSRGGGADRFGPRGRREGFEEEGQATVEGILHMHRDGFGFVHPVSGEGENIFLPPGEAQRALDNDRVVVEVSGRPGRYEGRLVRVVARRRELAVGTYVEQGRHALVYPTDASLPGPIRVPLTQMAQEGDLVKVRLGVGAQLLDPSRGLYGEVAGSLGKPGEPSAEVLGIAFSQGFSDEFPPEAMDEADRYAVTVTEEEARGEQRKDLRSMPLITIDGEDARDFDDAVYAEAHADGWRLVVAIADVSHYVFEGTGLNAEALRRATSVYLPNRVLPMLPERLSNGICSLKPDEDRLCMVAEMTFDRRGHRRSYELYPAVMRSAARCTYNEVQDVLDGKDVPHRNAFKAHFETLMALARALMKMRKERGAIDFDLPEHKVMLGKDGLPERMDKRERKDAHRLIEECMLAANEAVARFFQDEGLPTVYRFHGEPDPEKLATFAALAEAYGFKLRFEDGVPSKELDAFIGQLAGHPEQRALNQLLLRSMMQAIYTASRVGHYGLAAEHYLHFTSPIRRYPDLLVHRLLKAHWARKGRKPSESMLEREETQLEDMAVQCSERERAAMQVEREVVSFYACLLMKDRVGEEFSATVAAITDFGFFVELDEEHVEGLVKAETLGPGAKLDKLTHALVYAGGRRVRVGQKLRVRLASVNVTARKMDFDALQFDNEAPLERFAARAPARRRTEWAEPQRREHGRERAGRPGRRERESAKAGPERQWGAEESAGRPRGRFVREGRREEAAPTRSESRFKRPWQEQGAPQRPGPAHGETKGPKRRMFVRPEPPAFPAADRQPQHEGAERPEGQGGSPHPGFDRIRALASQRKHGGKETRGQAFRPPIPKAETPEPGHAASEQGAAVHEPRRATHEQASAAHEPVPAAHDTPEPRRGASEHVPAPHARGSAAHEPRRATQEHAAAPSSRAQGASGAEAPEPVAAAPELTYAARETAEAPPARTKKKAARKSTAKAAKKRAAPRKKAAAKATTARKPKKAKVAKTKPAKAAKVAKTAKARKAPKATKPRAAKGGAKSKTPARRKR